jgi:hypothetical protein
MMRVQADDGGDLVEQVILAVGEAGQEDHYGVFTSEQQAAAYATQGLGLGVGEEGARHFWTPALIQPETAPGGVRVIVVDAKVEESIRAYLQGLARVVQMNQAAERGEVSYEKTDERAADLGELAREILEGLFGINPLEFSGGVGEEGEEGEALGGGGDEDEEG